MHTITKETVVEIIRGAILDVVGPEWAAEIAVDAQTNIGSGMELDSIELSKVIETVFRTYPDVPFDTWFAGMGIERVMSLTVGDIAEFVAQSRAPAGVAA